MTTQKPLRPSVTQVNRVLSMPVGSGFFIWNLDGKRAEVVEFEVTPEGELLYADGKNKGEPLTYFCELDGNKVSYIILRKIVNDENNARS